MITTDLLRSITYKHDIKSYNTAFEYLFLKNQTIDILTQEKTAACNVILEEIHFLEELLLDEDRQNYNVFTAAELDEYQQQSNRAKNSITAFTSAKFITEAQSQYLLHCVAIPDLYPFNLSEFCVISNVNPNLTNKDTIEIGHYTDRTIIWELTQNKSSTNN